jgi:hypothetical protein
LLQGGYMRGPTVILLLALSACTPANRKGGIVIGGGLVLGGVGVAVADQTIERPRNDSWINFDDAIMPTAITTAALGAVILIASLLADKQPSPPPLPPATAAR